MYNITTNQTYLPIRFNKLIKKGKCFRCDVMKCHFSTAIKLSSCWWRMFLFDRFNAEKLGFKGFKVDLSSQSDDLTPKLHT